MKNKNHTPANSMTKTRGRTICDALKQVRQQIADAYNIAYRPRECHHEGECRGTCPACEAEVRWLEQSLVSKFGNNLTQKVAGLAIGLTALSQSAKAQTNSPETAPKTYPHHYYNAKPIELNPDSLEKEGYYLVKGVVKDLLCEPIIGAKITSGENKFTTVSDFDGKYIIPLMPGDSIEISFIGCEPTIIPFDSLDTKDLNVTALKDDTSSLTGEAVVVGGISPRNAKRQMRKEEKERRKAEKAEQKRQKALAKQQTMAENKIFGGIEETMCSFPGGNTALMEYLQKNVRIPQETCGQGRVVVSFIVTKHGKIKDAQVVRGIEPQYDHEALRVVNAMPDWIPAQINGKPTEAKYILPITFRLQ